MTLDSKLIRFSSSCKVMGARGADPEEEVHLEPQDRVSKCSVSENLTAGKDLKFTKILHTKIKINEKKNFLPLMKAVKIKECPLIRKRSIQGS